MSANRGLAFSSKEDQALCYAWLEVSEDPVMGTNQKEHKLWDRVSAIFHNTRPQSCIGQRTPKSLACRWAFLASKASKFRGCIRQIEQRNPSGASELDILDQAKILYAEDPKEKKGFLFDHVWSILKNTEKWIDTSGSTKGKNSQNIDMSQTLGSNSPSERRGIDLNTDSNEMNPGSTGDEESPISTSINRPTGRKQEKERRRKLSTKSHDIEAHTKRNEEILTVLKRGQEQRELEMSSMQELMRLNAENERRRLELRSAKQDHDIMMIDLASIKGTPERQYFRQKKQAIINKNIKKPLFGGSSSVEQTEYGGGVYGGSGYGGSQCRGSQYERDSHGGPQFGGSQFGGPQFGGPQFGGPQFGGPQFEGPQFGGPPLGGSQYRESQYRESQYRESQYGGSQFGGPQFGGDQHGGSQYGGSDYGVPRYEGEQHGEPNDDLPEF